VAVVDEEVALLESAFKDFAVATSTTSIGNSVVVLWQDEAVAYYFE
jgi:hypothetical protein